MHQKYVYVQLYIILLGFSENNNITENSLKINQIINMTFRPVINFTDGLKYKPRRIIIVETYHKFSATKQLI